MKVQFLVHDKKKECENKIFFINGIDDPMSLDEFHLNIIDLSDKKYWVSHSSSLKDIVRKKDLENLGGMITESVLTKILIILPANENFHRLDSYTDKVETIDQLKNILHSVSGVVELLVEKNYRALNYEPTRTTIQKKEVGASFYFSGHTNIVTKSVKSQKATTITDHKKRIYITTLQFSPIEILIPYLKEIGLINENKESEPGWMRDIAMFDDSEQLEKIKISEQKIKEEQELIDNSNEKLKQNKKYKSILYTQSDELVDVVFEMIEEMLGVNLKEFVDNKKEDIGFKIDGEYFIGEIKGISDNVKAGRLSQLDNHLYHFLDKNSEVTEDNVRRLLIINHQRNKPLDDRDPIDINQINLATNKYGSLIIETSTLLALFEKFKNNEIQTEEIVRLFRQTGKLTL